MNKDIKYWFGSWIVLSGAILFALAFYHSAFSLEIRPYPPGGLAGWIFYDSLCFLAALRIIDFAKKK